MAYFDFDLIKLNLA